MRLKKLKLSKSLQLCILHFSFMALILSSCNLINPASPIPSYIRLEKTTLTTNRPTQGTSSNAITDAWVYVDGQIIGVFQMPVNVPLLYSGVHTLTIRPGVIVNGIAATRIAYPFYASYTKEVSLESGKTITVNDSTQYNSATFSLLEDFDQSGITLKRSPFYSDSIHIISDPAICMQGEGKCGAALLSTSNPSFEFIAIDSFPMPLSAPQYMELNYKTNYEFTIGLQTFINGTLVNSGDDVVILRPTDTWQKVYVNLNTISQLYPTGTYFKIYLRAELSGQSAAAIYFDNIKVVHSG